MDQFMNNDATKIRLIIIKFIQKFFFGKNNDKEVIRF